MVASYHCLVLLLSTEPLPLPHQCDIIIADQAVRMSVSQQVCMQVCTGVCISHVCWLLGLAVSYQPYQLSTINKMGFVPGLGGEGHNSNYLMRLQQCVSTLLNTDPPQGIAMPTVSL